MHRFKWETSLKNFLMKLIFKKGVFIGKNVIFVFAVR